MIALVFPTIIPIYLKFSELSIPAIVSIVSSPISASNLLLISTAEYLRAKNLSNVNNLTKFMNKRKTLIFLLFIFLMVNIACSYSSLGLREENILFSKRRDEMNFLVEGDLALVSSWDILWGGSGRDCGVKIASDGEGIYVTGSTDFGVGGGDVFLLKLDKRGNIIWSKVWGTGGCEAGMDLDVTDDAVYVAGGYSGILKFSKNGELIWSKRIIANESVFDTASIKVVGNEIFVGDYNYELAKLKEDGDSVKVVWVLSLPFEPTLLEVTGDYIYAAFRDGNIIAKFSRTDGRVLWMKQLNIVIKDMMVFSNGIFIAGGSVICKLNLDGDLVWAKSLGASDFYIEAIHVDNYHVYVAGYLGFFDECIVLVFDRNGNLICGYIYGGSSDEWFTDILVLNGGIYAVGGAFDLYRELEKADISLQHVSMNVTSLQPDFEYVQGRIENVRGKVTSPDGSNTPAGSIDVLVVAFNVEAVKNIIPEIWVDKGCGSAYNIGDPIIIYFKVNVRAYVRIVDEFPDGSTKLLYSGWVDGGVTYYIKGVMGEPAGYRIFHIYAEDEYGNTAHDECYVGVGGKPDLIVGDVSWSPSEVVKGDVVKFMVKVGNEGYSDAGSFYVALELGGGIVDEVLVDGLSAGESKTVYLKWEAKEAGEHTLRIVVDYYNDIDEINEKNNVKIITIKAEENNPPVAYIDSISPNPVVKGELITFEGHGEDPDGDDIVAYEWKSSIDGFLSNERSFSTGKLSAGKHTIFFRVKDSRGAWSDWTTLVLIVEESPEICLYTDKLSYEKPYNINFKVTVISDIYPKTYIGKIIIRAPNGNIYTIERFSIDHDSRLTEHTVEWNAPEDVVPGTYFVLLTVTSESGVIIAEEGTAFYLDDPDKSYVESFELNGIFLIHMHLQRYGIYLGDIPPQLRWEGRKLIWKALRLDVVGFSIDSLEALYSTAKSELKGVVSLTEPYDVTVIVLSGEIYGNYLGVIYEAPPLKASHKEIRDLTVDIGKDIILKEVFNVEIPSIPIPLERFTIISKETYEGLVNGPCYKYLPVLTELKVVYLTSPQPSYEIGRTIGMYVKFIDPRTDKVLTNAEIVAAIGPASVSLTSTVLGQVYFRYLGNGVYRIEIDPTTVEMIYDIYHASEYSLYFIASAPGYYGVSPSIPITIINKRSFADIGGLYYTVNPVNVSFSENVQIFVSFDATSYVSDGVVSVKVKVFKKIFGFFPVKIAEEKAQLGHNDVKITLKGDQIANWFLFWPLQGNYKIYVKITVTYTSYKTTFTESISEELPPITINVHD